MRAYFTDRNVRRVFVLLLFLGLLWFFRHLFLLFVFFVVFERTFGLMADLLSAATKLKFKHSLLLSLLLSVLAIAGAGWLGVSQLVAHLPEIRQGGHAIVDTIRASPLYDRLGELDGHAALQHVMASAQEHAGGIAQFVATVGKDTLYVFIALVFAVVFLLEREELETFREKMATDSVPRILLRYTGHAADAIAITLKLQVIVAVVNTLVTLPVLIALRLPGIPALMAMLLVTGLIPVVGGPVAGAVLMVLAYVTRGPMGLGIFLASTFVLHKIESYYLNPRLTAKHVKLPSFVIIVSLVLFEHAFGLVGLFLSFPTLYVAARIREGWVDPEQEARADEETARSMRGALAGAAGFKLKPGVLSSLRRASDGASTAPKAEESGAGEGS